MKDKFFPLSPLEDGQYFFFFKNFMGKMVELWVSKILFWCIEYNVVRIEKHRISHQVFFFYYSIYNVMTKIAHSSLALRRDAVNRQPFFARRKSSSWLNFAAARGFANYYGCAISSFYGLIKHQVSLRVL